MSGDIQKSVLYEAVKQLVDNDKPHLHMNQHKLFTLFSIAFQYMLFLSTKNPGAYILRIEDSALAEKLSKKSKDPSTRSFIRSLMIPRKIKFGNSWFYLDYFHISSWNFTKDIPPEKVKGAIVVKNTSAKPMNELLVDEEDSMPLDNLPKNYFLTSLTDFVPRTITIAFEETFDGVEIIEFPFIKKDREKTFGGVKIADDLDLDSLE